MCFRRMQQFNIVVSWWTCILFLLLTTQLCYIWYNYYTARFLFLSSLSITVYVAHRANFLYTFPPSLECQWQLLTTTRNCSWPVPSAWLQCDGLTGCYAPHTTVHWTADGPHTYTQHYKTQDSTHTIVSLQQQTDRKHKQMLLVKFSETNNELQSKEAPKWLPDVYISVKKTWEVKSNFNFKCSHLFTVRYVQSTKW